ncbi:MAG: PQQ-dependent sugar dehydrogenase [Promethearchaeota archaeon]
MNKISLIIVVISFLTFSRLLFTTSIEIAESVEFTVEQAFPNLTFTNPIGLYYSNDDSNRLFVVEQEGIIFSFNNSKFVSSTNIFLDISDKVLFGGEQGLLGLVFHPNYSSNGYFYLNYIADNPRRTVIARYSVMNNNSDQANTTSELLLLEVSQPYANHNGGQLAFGPDGYLYIALGDGGSGGDPLGNGQNRSTLLGSILRIDVDNNSPTTTYSIPSDNPFVGTPENFRKEIFAYGLRNPWRFSIDPLTGWLWAGDVGQNKIEEIDIIEKGGNYGWNIMEGSHCYSPSTGCNQSNLILPIFEYGHDIGISITGGYVYRGSNLKTLYGNYIYGDYGSGRIWALSSDNSTIQNHLLIDTTFNIVSFGVDKTNELYICAFDGKIHKLKETITETSPTDIPIPTTTINTSTSISSLMSTEDDTRNQITSKETTTEETTQKNLFPTSGFPFILMIVIIPFIVFLKRRM